MTSSFLPSDLSGIFYCSTLPPPSSSSTHIHTHSLLLVHSHLSSISAPPATMCLVVFLSHLASPSTTPHPVLPATLPLSPKGIIHYEVEHSFKVKCQWVCYWKLCWVAPSVATVTALFWQLHWSHLIPKPMGPWLPQLQVSGGTGNQ